MAQSDKEKDKEKEKDGRPVHREPDPEIALSTNPAGKSAFTCIESSQPEPVLIIFARNNEHTKPRTPA